MKLLVTGATGFLGRHVVAEALRRGHRVVALARQRPDPALCGWIADAGVEALALDLRTPDGLKEKLADVDAVIHLAAVLHGDLETHRVGTVATTEALLAAMVAAGCDRLILVSSLSVYDYRQIPAFGVLDEQSPLEARPDEREPYCWAKLRQEELARAQAERGALALTVLRPGAVIGAGHTWIDALGLRVGERLWLRFGAAGMPLPLTCAENCADAIVTAAERPEAIGETFNVVDDDLPSRRDYAAALRGRLERRPLVIALPGSWLRALARALAPLARRRHLPWFVDAARVETQLKPLRFSNAHLENTLGWRPRTPLAEALGRGPGRA